MTATILRFPGTRAPAAPASPKAFRSLQWVTLYHLDGREWRGAGFYSPVEAWAWVTEQVAVEYGCDPEDVDCVEEFGGDLVTVDGFPLYRAVHTK